MVSPRLLSCAGEVTGEKTGRVSFVHFLQFVVIGQGDGDDPLEDIMQVRMTVGENIGINKQTAATTTTTSHTHTCLLYTSDAADES